MANYGAKSGNDVVANPSPLAFLPQLDGLRAFAVLLVLIQHFCSAENLLRGAKVGSFGVRLFFVLSGFLITGILLKCREQQEDGAKPSFLLRQFYARRFLRILPAYYVFLLLLVLMGVNGTVGRPALPWVLVFLTNFFIGFRPDQTTYYLDHLWSLAVEEHFYLFWPLVMLFVPRRWLAVVCWATILFGPIARFFILTAVPHYESWRSITFANVDPLGAGALLAVTTWTRKGDSPLPWLPSQQTLERIGLWIGLPLTLVLMAVDIKNLAAGPTFLVRNSVFSFSCLWLVSRSARGGDWLPGRVLEWKPIGWMGRISYGIYLYHLALPVFFAPLLLGMSRSAALDTRAIPPGAEKFWVMAPLSVAVAAVSWYLIEKPLNGLKRFFPYRP